VDAPVERREADEGDDACAFLLSVFHFPSYVTPTWMIGLRVKWIGEDLQEAEGKQAEE
jgi:hypothetical protein